MLNIVWQKSGILTVSVTTACVHLNQWTNMNKAIIISTRGRRKREVYELFWYLFAQSCPHNGSRWEKQLLLIFSCFFHWGYFLFSVNPNAWVYTNIFFESKHMKLCLESVVVANSVSVSLWPKNKTHYWPKVKPISHCHFSKHKDAVSKSVPL